jgi:hypothetical protein
VLGLVAVLMAAVAGGVMFLRASPVPTRDVERVSSTGSRSGPADSDEELVEDVDANLGAARTDAESSRRLVKPTFESPAGEVEELATSAAEPVRREIRIAGAVCTEERSATSLRVRFSTGNLYFEVPLRDGKREGTARCFDRTGQLRAEENYAAGERNGRATFFSANGTKIAEGEYRAGFREGPWRTWYSDGKPESEGSYRLEWSEASGAPARPLAAERTGLWTWWLPDGSIDAASSGRYAHDEGAQR